MSNYRLSYTQQIVISRLEYERVAALIDSKHRIILIHDVDGHNHLIDWHYVIDNQIEPIKSPKPESLPE